MGSGTKFLQSFLENRKSATIYTQMTPKIGNMPRRRPEFEQALPAPKQLNLKSLAPGSPKTHRLWGGVQASSNSVAVRRWQKPIFGVICVSPILRTI